MKKISNALKYVILAICLIMPVQLLAAENPAPMFWLGLYGDYNHDIHFVSFNALPGVPSCCPEYTDGTGNGYSFGGLFEINLIKDLNFGLRIGYANLDAQMKKNENAAFTDVIDENKKETYKDLLVEHSLNARLHGIGIEPLINFKFFDNFNANFGFNLTYFFTETVDQKELILSPLNVTFRDGRIIRNDQNGLQIPNNNAIQFFGMFGLSYDLKIGKETYLSPEVKYLLPFNNISSVPWKASALQLGLSLKVPFYAPVPVPEYRDTVYQRDTTVIAKIGLKSDYIKITKRYKPENYKISTQDSIIFRTILKESYEKQVPKAVALSSSVDVVGINRDSTRQEKPTIVIEETETSESFPLLPYIFFKENSDRLNETNLRLLSKDNAASFSEKNMTWNTLDIYQDLLNIVSSRLIENKGASITIAGCNDNIGDEKGNTKLSAARAEAVKNYLTNVWGINPENIKVKKQNLPDNPGKSDNPDGIEENRRAEITSSNPDILKPVNLKEIQLTANPPVIEILPTVNTELSVKSWEAIISQDGKEIRKYSGTSAPNKLRWNVEDNPVPRFESPIHINFKAVDEIDQQTESNSDLKIQQLTIKKKRKEIKNDTIVERYSLILFDYDKAELTAHQKPLLQEIRDKIKPNSLVTISGYADRTGDSDYNRDLAYRRTVEVQKILQIPQDRLRLNPVGSDILLYNNDQPQGRSYCRTVQIVIETPIKE